MTLPAALLDVYERYREDPAFERMRAPGRLVVAGEGSSQPNVMIVGEAPGATENTAKRPFVGASGKVLRSLILDVAGLQPEEWFITNAVKYWPGPGNPTPDGDLIAAGRSYLRDEWKALGSPPVLIAVGGVARQAMAPDVPSVTQAAGQAFSRPGGTALWVMLHPSYGLRKKEVRPAMEQHWEEFGKWYSREYR